MTLSILIIEDNDINRRLLADVVRVARHTPYLAETVEEAKSILVNTQIHLLLSDLFMSEVNIAEDLKQIRQNFPHLPIWIMTGADAQHVETLCHEQNMGYLQKPLNVGELLMLFQQEEQACQHAS